MIIEKVAPYFNRHGYTGTSLSDITKAVGLTKGAIYGNFKDKESLAILAFEHNENKIMLKMKKELPIEKSGLKRLKGITNFYRNYYDFVVDFGGCPILNVGIDSLHHHNALYKKVIEVINKLRSSIQQLIEKGISDGEIKQSINPKEYANKIYAQIQGSIFLALMLKEKKQMQVMMDHIDMMIDTELKIN